MQRRNVVKAIAIGTVAPDFFLHRPAPNQAVASPDQQTNFKSAWQHWPDLPWVGPGYWGNRLQDWQIEQGKAICDVSEPNRSLHCLTCQLSDQVAAFESSVVLRIRNQQAPASARNYVGFRLGAQASFPDYRAAAVLGEGLDAGVTTEGRLFIGDKENSQPVDVKEPVHLQLQATPEQVQYSLKLRAVNPDNQQTMAELTVAGIPAETLTGNIALVSHFADAEETSAHPAVAFENWEIQGGKVQHNPDQTFGPICFAQYTLHKSTLKLSAQLAPIEALSGYQVSLQI